MLTSRLDDGSVSSVCLVRLVAQGDLIPLLVQARVPDLSTLSCPCYVASQGATLFSKSLEDSIAACVVYLLYSLSGRAKRHSRIVPRCVTEI